MAVPTERSILKYEVQQASAGVPLATAKPCEVHRVHWTPKPTYCEEHHVIPQAWQRFWRPSNATSTSERRRNVAAHDPAEFDALMATVDLFDPRVVVVCRTGHGNIHFWLVAIMHEFDSNSFLDDPSKENVVNVVDLLAGKAQQKLAPTAGRKDLAVAKLGIVRWVQAGGSVRALTNADLFGVI